MSEVNKELATKALKRLDEILDSNYHSSFRVIIGGGGAMILAHEYPGASVDLDGMMASKIESIKDSIEQVAIELGLSGDWLNPYYQAFTHYLPEDYGNRLVLVLPGEVIKVECLGSEDVLIMKLMAGRDKDLKHIKHLLSQSDIDLSIVEKRLEELKELSHTKNEATKALDFFDDLTGDRD